MSAIQVFNSLGYYIIIDSPYFLELKHDREQGGNFFNIRYDYDDKKISKIDGITYKELPFTTDEIFACALLIKEANGDETY